MTGQPEFTNWQEAWEWHAKQTSDSFAQLNESQLLELIAARHYDIYYTIWYNLRKVGSLKNCAPVLLDVLRRESDHEMDLVRYHCAAALFHLLGYPDDPMPEIRKQVQWDHQGEQARQQAIDELEAMIQARINAGA